MLPDELALKEEKSLPQSSPQEIQVGIEGKPKPTLSDILQAVERATDVAVGSITGPTQSRNVSNARRLFAYCAIHLGKYSGVEVAQALGRTPAFVSVANREVTDQHERWRLMIDAVARGLS